MKRQNLAQRLFEFLTLVLILISFQNTSFAKSIKKNTPSAPATQVPAELQWILKMNHEQDIPFSSKTNEINRLGMLIELGKKHPAVDCSADCSAQFNMKQCLRHCDRNSGKSCPAACETARNLKAQACQLGLVGATYYLTGFQEITKRSEELIWHGPNSSLNIEAYAYMKERELGISCEQSVFIKRFPTRASLSGESKSPITRLEVCHAWNHYFHAAGDGLVRPRVDFIEGYAPETGLSPEDWQKEREIRRREINFIQSLMWKAHTFAILHAYWQNLHRFKRSQQMHVPRDEYRMWMGWNKLVGGMIPSLNLNSCVGSAEFLAYQLMPNCVVGEILHNGRICKGTPEPGASIFGNIKSEIFHQMQAERASEDFIEAIEAFSSPMEAEHKVPYRWPENTVEPFSFSRAR